MGISEQSTLLCEQKMLTSRQIFWYAVPARTVTKKALFITVILNIKLYRCKQGNTLPLNCGNSTQHLHHDRH